MRKQVTMVVKNTRLGRSCLGSHEDLGERRAAATCFGTPHVRKVSGINSSCGSINVTEVYFETASTYSISSEWARMSQVYRFEKRSKFELR
ncbi:hypothetical protein JTE90_005180 [Oedothorax gibbosus]|uniref:Uncharacterized protein n=1 Tax=Oedothorax gibbosus TaxID=931172 RepID=A0AAV6UJJ7_9ARAC|nr:hypothetical protein JTE90_005180 [Oedothorax gibbosus]